MMYDKAFQPRPHCDSIICDSISSSRMSNRTSNGQVENLSSGTADVAELLTRKVPTSFDSTCITRICSHDQLEMIAIISNIQISSPVQCNRICTTFIYNENSAQTWWTKWAKRRPRQRKQNVAGSIHMNWISIYAECPDDKLQRRSKEENCYGKLARSKHENARQDYSDSFWIQDFICKLWWNPCMRKWNW